MAQTTSILKDVEGNVYKTVKIGDQVWMAENLRTTKFNDGTPIPKVMDDSTWEGLSTPAYCYYNNTTDVDSIKKFGALYNSDAMIKKNIAPRGWHVPTDRDWLILEQFLMQDEYYCKGAKDEDDIAKALASQTDWLTNEYRGTIGCDLSLNNKSGFTALPAGSRSTIGDFNGIGSYAGWWSSTEGASREITRNFSSEDRHMNRGHIRGNLHRGISVRLVRD